MHLKLSTVVELHDEKQVSDMSVYYMLILAVHILFNSKTEKKNPKKKNNKQPYRKFILLPFHSKKTSSVD